MTRFRTWIWISCEFNSNQNWCFNISNL